MNPQNNSERKSYEPDEPRTGTILRIAGWILLILLGVLILLWPWQPEPVVPLPGASTREGPRLLSDPVAHLQQYRTEKRARLNSYGWVDRQAGLAHIPVQRAMELLSQSSTEKHPETKP